jgi:3-hydroxyisobutyrate dehydrogenase-like beta-hydroxyacid dehydrogenase
MNLKTMTIGAVGLGQMGGGIAENLARAGYRVLGFDPRPEAQERLRAAGGALAAAMAALVAESDIILLSLEAKIAMSVTENWLLPHCRAGQIVIDHSTLPVPQTRALGAALEAQGVRYMDAPVSGGGGGASSGTLRIFVGGDLDLYEQLLPLFHVAGNPEKVHHYGGIGMGQVAKVVQQLAVRWPDMARLEVMAFGARNGLDKARLMQALDVDPGSNDRYAALYRHIEAEQKEILGGLISEWPYFLEQVRAAGLRMPMLEALYAFAKDGEPASVDPVGRPMPSIWDELMKAGAEELAPEE